MPLHEPDIKDLTAFKADFLGSSINADTSIRLVDLSSWVRVGDIG